MVPAGHSAFAAVLPTDDVVHADGVEKLVPVAGQQASIPRLLRDARTCPPHSRRRSSSAPSISAPESLLTRKDAPSPGEGVNQGPSTVAHRFAMNW